MKELARNLVAKQTVNLKLAKFVLNDTAALRINESSAGNRAHVPVHSDYCVDNHVNTFTGGSKMRGSDDTRPPYAKLSLFKDTITNGLLDIIFRRAVAPGLDRQDDDHNRIRHAHATVLCFAFHHPACRAALLAEPLPVARCAIHRTDF